MTGNKKNTRCGLRRQRRAKTHRWHQAWADPGETGLSRVRPPPAEGAGSSTLLYQPAQVSHMNCALDVVGPACVGLVKQSCVTIDTHARLAFGPGECVKFEVTYPALAIGLMRDGVSGATRRPRATNA